MRSGGTDPHIFKLGRIPKVSGWSPSDSQTALTPRRKRCDFSFKGRLGGSHIPPGRIGEEQKELPLPIIQCTARGLFTTLTTALGIK
jgi:hypothetical protein